MAIKHKVLKDFQFVTNDKKIVILKAKTVLENYKYTNKNDSISLERDVIDNNPDFFATIDWKEELNTYIKQNKIPQPAILTKKLVPFIEEMFILNQSEPTIVEVPVTKVIDKSTDLTLLEVELENKLRKVELKDSKLKEEQYLIDKKELELKEKEELLNRKNSELDLLKSKLELLESDIVNRINSLDEKEKEVNSKIENQSKYISKEIVKELINTEMKNRKGCRGCGWTEIPPEIYTILNSIDNINN